MLLTVFYFLVVLWGLIQFHIIYSMTVVIFGEIGVILINFCFFWVYPE